MISGSEEKNKSHTYLSKSMFIKGLQCHKALYLQKYRSELKDEISEDTQKRFDIGHDVGSIAQQLFPGGVMVPYEGLSHSEQIEMTQSLIRQSVDTIYEATFFHNDVFVKADILHRGKSGWEIYEVKASASVNEYHLNDISVQYHIISGTGLPVAKVFIVHINTGYVRHGEIDVKKLFTTVDITGTAKDKGPFIIDELKRQRIMLDSEEPSIDIGPQCNDPFVCDFKGHCWSHIPSPSVFDYKDIGKPDAFALYKQGIVKMADVPPDILGWRQKLQLKGLLYQQNHIDAGAINNFIESLWYPLCFIDFETTFMVPIPMYDGISPYQQVPFQFSLHIIREPGGELEHHEFLADGSTNPQKEFLEGLLKAVPHNACTLVWNQTFEISWLKELADAFPEKNADIYRIIENIRDLMIPFRDKAIYHWKFNGYYSLKAVLPALVPELSYENLEISNGEMASSAWMHMVRSNDEVEKSMTRQQLLQYCRLDTLAMVRILQEMRKLIGM